MAKLTTDVKKALHKIKLFPFATSSNAGTPNVVPVKFVFIENDTELWIVDNFMSKTIKNMAQNPKAALYVYDDDNSSCCQIKGDVTIQTSGDNFDRMRKNIRKLLPTAPAKSLVVMNVTDIYQCVPGIDSGKRLN